MTIHEDLKPSAKGPFGYEPSMGLAVMSIPDLKLNKIKKIETHGFTKDDVIQSQRRVQ